MTMNNANTHQRLLEKPLMLFINPDRDMSGERIVHQGISSIASYLIDRGIGSHALLTSLCSDDYILERISQYAYTYVGFYLTSDDSAIGYARSLMKKIKNVNNNMIFVAGGPHATLGSDELMTQLPDMDLCVRGEGEETCYEILSGKAYTSINGLTYRWNGVITSTPNRGLLSAADLPSPIRYNYFHSDWNAHSLSTSRGCPNNCQYCIGHEIFGRTIRFKPLDKIRQELQWIQDCDKRNLVVSINDDMFNMRKDRTLALMELFKKFPFHYFPRGMRADRLDAETTRAMREAKVVGTSIGIESADNESLKIMCKGETIEEIERGIQHLRNNGISIVAQFMIGNIGDTLETVKKTIDFALRHRFEDINMSCAIPFPGTALRQYVEKNNLMLKEPYQAAKGVVNGNTVIYFETPNFPLADRVKAVELAIDAGLLRIQKQ